jgi:hypothetical protein
MNVGLLAGYGRSRKRAAPKKVLENGVADMIREGDMTELDAPFRPPRF